MSDPRQERGWEIAATARITRKGSRWFVPSHSGQGRYTVNLRTKMPHCDCPDHETNGRECKHILAVKYALRWKKKDIRAGLDEQRAIDEKTERKT
jgi:predicted nucleic acid-binding Zn finger protein